MNNKKTILYVDDDYESMGTLLKLRAPALIIGLLLGIGISFITSSLEDVISHNVQVAFFLPFIVYISDAAGTQTGAIYSRNLTTGKAKFGNYFHKELMLGVIFGLVFGAFSGTIWHSYGSRIICLPSACLWQHSQRPRPLPWWRY